MGPMVGLESQPLDVPQAHLSDAQGKTANLSPAGSRLSGGVCITGKVSVFCNGQDSQGTLLRALSRRVPGGGVVCFAGGARLPAVPMNCGGLFQGPFQADGLELQAENKTIRQPGGAARKRNYTDLSSYKQIWSSSSDSQRRQTPTAHALLFVC